MQCRNPKPHETHRHVVEAGGLVCAQGQCPGRSDAAPHADRDRSEPYWPPAATREPRVRFPLDDGDTGAALLPVAPTGTLLHCPVCPAALADTRGGRLDHCDDGSHHYVPEADAEAAAERRRRYATALDLHSFALASTYWQRFVLRVMAVADAEQAELQAALLRVRALADAFADDGLPRHGGNIAWHIEEAIANEKGDFPDAADQRIASQRDRAEAAERALAGELATSHSLREGVIKQLGEMLTEERAKVARIEAVVNDEFGFTYDAIRAALADPTPQAAQ